MFRDEHELLAGSLQSLDGELAVDHGDDDPAGSSGDGSIHDQQVAIVDAGTLHGSPACSQKERGGWSSDEFLVEIERPFHVVVGRRGKAGFHPRRQEWANNGWCGRIGPEWAAIVHGPIP